MKTSNQTKHTTTNPEQTWAAIPDALLESVIGGTKIGSDDCGKPGCEVNHNALTT